jgi:hypothetical protein
VIAAPTGSGKTTQMAKQVAEHGSTCWLTDRHDGVDATCAMIETYGGSVGRVVRLGGKQSDGTRNCLHPKVIGYGRRRAITTSKVSARSAATAKPTSRSARFSHRSRISNTRVLSSARKPTPVEMTSSPKSVIPDVGMLC